MFSCELGYKIIAHFVRNSEISRASALQAPSARARLNAAVQGTAVGDAIRAYRQDDRVDGAITFGMNAVLEGLHDGAELAVGQSVAGDWQFA